MKTYSCGLNWFGPFTNIQQVKEWEDSNGNDTNLYLIRGKKKVRKKSTCILLRTSIQTIRRKANTQQAPSYRGSCSSC